MASSDVIREHWKIENLLYYMLDAFLSEDGWTKGTEEAVKDMGLNFFIL